MCVVSCLIASKPSLSLEVIIFTDESLKILNYSEHPASALPQSLQSNTKNIFIKI